MPYFHPPARPLYPPPPFSPSPATDASPLHPPPNVLVEDEENNGAVFMVKGSAYRDVLRVARDHSNLVRMLYGEQDRRYGGLVWDTSQGLTHEEARSITSAEYSDGLTVYRVGYSGAGVGDRLRMTADGGGIVSVVHQVVTLGSRNGCSIADPFEVKQLADITHDAPRRVLVLTVRGGGGDTPFAQPNNTGEDLIKYEVECYDQAVLRSIYYFLLIRHDRLQDSLDPVGALQDTISRAQPRKVPAYSSGSAPPMESGGQLQERVANLERLLTATSLPLSHDTASSPPSTVPRPFPTIPGPPATMTHRPFQQPPPPFASPVPPPVQETASSPVWAKPSLPNPPSGHHSPPPLPLSPTIPMHGDSARAQLEELRRSASSLIHSQSSAPSSRQSEPTGGGFTTGGGHALHLYSEPPAPSRRSSARKATPAVPLLATGARPETMSTISSSQSKPGPLINALESSTKSHPAVASNLSEESATLSRTNSVVSSVLSSAEAVEQMVREETEEADSEADGTERNVQPEQSTATTVALNAPSNTPALQPSPVDQELPSVRFDDSPKPLPDGTTFSIGSTMTSGSSYNCHGAGSYTHRLHARTPLRQSATRAVVIGADYDGVSCSSAAKDMAGFLVQQEFHAEQCVLSDNLPDRLPTKKNILAALRWLVKDTRPGSALFLSFTGKGLEDTDAQQYAYNCTHGLFPSDSLVAGVIQDEELYDTIALRLPTGAKLTVVCDINAAYQFLNLPFLLAAGRRGGEVALQSSYHRTGTAPECRGLVLVVTATWEGARADAYQEGLLNAAFMHAYRTKQQLTMQELVASMRSYMIERGGPHVPMPVLCSNQPITKSSPFSLFRLAS